MTCLGFPRAFDTWYLGGNKENAGWLTWREWIGPWSWRVGSRPGEIMVLEPTIHLGEVSGQKAITGCGFVEEGCWDPPQAHYKKVKKVLGTCPWGVWLWAKALRSRKGTEQNESCSHNQDARPKSQPHLVHSFSPGLPGAGSWRKNQASQLNFYFKNLA